MGFLNNKPAQGIAALDDWQSARLPPYLRDQQLPIGYMPPELAGQFPPTGENGPMDAGSSFGGGVKRFAPRASSARQPVQLAPVPGPVAAPQGQPDSAAPVVDKSKLPAPHQGGVGGALQRAFHGLGAMARSGELQMRLAMSEATMRGDSGAAAQLATQLAALRAQQAQTQEASAVRQSLANNLMKGGMDAAEVERVMANPTAFGTEYATRYRTRDGAPGTTISTPNLSGAPTLQQFPTAAEQAARAAGLQPGTPQFTTFIQDAALNAQGPTGTATTRRGQDFTREDNIRTNATSRANNADTNSTSRANNSATIAGANYRHTTPGARAPTPPTPTSVIGGIMARQAAGQPLNPQEQGLLQRYQMGRGRAAGRAGAGGPPVPVPGRTATNPRGIRVQQYSDGTWRPAQ